MSLNNYISGKLNWSFCVGVLHGQSGCHDWTGFWFLYLSQRGRFWMWVYASVIHREMLASRKCHLNLTFCRMGLKLSTTLKYVPLTDVCSCSSVRRWTQSTHVFPYAQKWDAFWKGDTGQRFWVMRAAPESSFRKTPLAAHFSDTEWATKLAYLCDICNLLSELDLSLQGRMTTVFKSADKVAAFKAKLELWGMNTGIFDMFQTLAEILKRLSQGFLPPSWCMITCLSSQKTHLWISQVNWLCLR